MPVRRDRRPGPSDEGSPESERSYRELFETSRDGIAHLNMAGRFVDCNPACLDFLGYPSVDSLRGLTFDNLSPLEYLPLNRQVVRQARERGYSDLVEKEYIRRNGERAPARIRALLRRDAQGNPIGTWVVLQDLRERRQTEAVVSRLREQLFRSQKMEAVGRLAGAVAHDFNNNLTTIIGYTILIRKVGTQDAAIVDAAREIEKAAMGASALVRQLLAFSGRQELSPKVIDLNEIVMNLKRMLERLVGEDVSLLIDLDSEACPIKADPGQIEQVIINLAVNARDAMPQGGRLLLHTRNTALDETFAREHAGVQPGEYVLLAVSDTGSGMDEGVKAHIFEPFFTAKEKGNGTGLGLSTVHGIVKQNGGHLWVSSEMGKGTSFKIYFPQQEGAAELSGLDVVPATPKGGTETILMVEDDPQLLSVTAMMLTDLGYTVIEKQSPREALAFIASSQGKAVGLLLTDVVMPEMSGRVLADRIEQIRPGIKVLFVSGYADDAVLDHGVMTSGILFLRKPYSLADLDRKVRDVLTETTIT
jgi:PAS domain S-box-containing protein